MWVFVCLCLVRFRFVLSREHFVRYFPFAFLQFYFPSFVFRLLTLYFAFKWPDYFYFRVIVFYFASTKTCFFMSTIWMKPNDLLLSFCVCECVCFFFIVSRRTFDKGWKLFEGKACNYFHRFLFSLS